MFYQGKRCFSIGGDQRQNDLRCLAIYIYMDVR